MGRILVCWIGHADLRAARGEVEGPGPIAQVVEAGWVDEALLLSDYPDDEAGAYVAWLRARSRVAVSVRDVDLSSPTDFGEIYRVATKAVDGLLTRGVQEDALVFHLSPGTPAMAAIWILLAKAKYMEADLVESSIQQGVRKVDIPFDISAEFLPELLRRRDEDLERLTAGLPPETPAFGEIIHRSSVMKRLIARARRVALHSVPVLIEGESGTGKELLARAIHHGSPRAGAPFVAINCGAIPAGLVESTLFGHERGAFTGADRSRPGCFEEADGGTLFLDEVGELPLEAQVKLLRVLQERRVIRVGLNRAVPVDVRVVAATNRNLLSEVAAGRFRSDLFYRLAVAILRLPPLRERPGDLGLLVERILEKINAEAAAVPGFLKKKLSPSAKNLLLRHSWPGNVRELQNTLQRASLWCSGPTIRAEDVREAILPLAGEHPDRILGRPLGKGLNLPEILAEVATHYLRRAMDEARGNKTEAARLVGLPSYQTLTNWLRRYGLDR